MINLGGNKLIIDLFLGDKSIAKVYKGEALVFAKVPDSGEPKPPTGETQLTLDQSVSSPTGMVTGELGKDGNPKKNVVSWIRANSHRYVGTYNSALGMVLKQLDDNNSEMYADGTSAASDITTKDVFMKMPTFWFRGEQLATNKYAIHFTAKEPTSGTWVKWDGDTLIGVYEAVCQDTGNNANGELYSRSGATPTVNVSQENFKAKARNRSNGDDHFMIVTYEAHMVMALLYIAYYGDNMNAQTVIGSGTSSYPKVAGQTNVDGMNDTKAQNSRSINFWGLENWWGDLYEWMDNLITYNTSGGINILNYDGGVERQVQVPTGSGNITKMLLGEKLDMIPSAMSGSSYTTYYCDYGYVHASSGRVARRSCNADYASGGPFCLRVYNTPSATSGSIGSRLLYYGRVTIEGQDTVSINSVEINPVASVMSIMRTRSAAPVTARIVIKGKNLDKLDSVITGLPEGITISELSEGTTERTAVITSTIAEELDTLKLNLGGYEIVIINPDKLPADLQRVYFNGSEVLRTGMDFHICGIEDFTSISSIELQGLNINYEDITFNTLENVTAEAFADRSVLVQGDNSVDEMALEMVYKEKVIGTLKFHKASEEEVLEALKEQMEEE